VERLTTHRSLPARLADFPTLADALDYAARGETGLSFYNASGELTATLPYRELRERALSLGRRLIASGLSRGDRIAAVAETDPDFAVLFFACQYAGLIPVPLPISLTLGGRRAYVDQLRGLLQGARPALATAPEALLPFLRDATKDVSGLPTHSTEELAALPDGEVELRPSGPDEIAYLQFTSGSTRFPRGVVVNQRNVMANLRGITRTGLRIQEGDRAASWLAFYHDMGLVGFLLGPVVSQVSVDYLRTRDFAVRPLSWLRLISQNRATIAFGSSIAFHLCTRRVKEEDLEALDLSCWRVAGVGAEMIRARTLHEFARALEPAGFDPGAFLPCYGLAEATLAATFSPTGAGVDSEVVDTDTLADGVADLAGPETRSVTEIVNCGVELPGHELKICDDSGEEVEERVVGRVLIRGASIMEGYFQEPEETAEVLDEDGWLDTGDLGFFTDDGLFVTGRMKDLIIINGRNIWPQDVEYVVEQIEGVRIGDASAFGVTSPQGEEVGVVVLQCRLSDRDARQRLIETVRRSVYEHHGLRCLVDLVPPGTLPHTSSGKLSRVEAKEDFLSRINWHDVQALAGVSRS